MADPGSHQHTGTLPAQQAGPTEPPLIETTIGEDLRRSAQRFAEREALVDVHAGKRWTYEEFRTEVRRLATGLHHAGVTKGQRVGVWGPNRWEWTLAQFATAELGAIMVTINPSYRQHELDHVLQQAGITAVIASDEFKGQDYPAMLAAAERERGALDLTVIMGDETWDALVRTPVDDELLDRLAAKLSPEDPINIQYTSGTTGFPKGATLTHRNILNNGFFVGEVCRYTEQDRICVPVPFYHCFGMVMGNLAATTHGSTMVIPAQAFDPQLTLQAVQDERCTSLYGVPTMFIAELGLPDLEDYDLSSLRTGIMAGSPCPEEIMRKVIEVMHMDEVTICYGMTETSPVSLQTRVDDDLDRRVGTVGRVSPHAEVKVVDPATGETLGIDVDGELCTRGYLVMQGYWEDPERTAEAIDADGWMHTGDMARMDAAGYVQITGRIKDMVIRGGENIYPREVEEFLHTHPDVIDAQVIGVPDEKYGEELMAWVRLRDGAEPLTVQDVQEHCAGQLARFKIPRYVHVVDEFPTTVTGKVRKVQMRQEAVDLLGAPGGADADGSASSTVR